MKLPYAWSCHACDASNSAEANTCSACGFPAKATAKQIDAVKALSEFKAEDAEVKVRSIPEIASSEQDLRKDDVVADVVKLVGAITVGVCGMYYVWNYIGPSGQTMSIGSFVLLFFRELFVVGIFGLALAIGCIVWLFRRVLNLFHRFGDAP